MGAIMAVGVAVANAILLATFAEQGRREGKEVDAAAVEGAKHRLRPILMTSCAMIAGMIPMALGLGEGGDQTSPLGVAVIGGLIFSAISTLIFLPLIYLRATKNKTYQDPSLNPDDKNSKFYETN